MGVNGSGAAACVPNSCPPKALPAQGTDTSGSPSPGSPRLARSPPTGRGSAKPSPPAQNVGGKGGGTDPHAQNAKGTNGCRSRMPSRPPVRKHRSRKASPPSPAVSLRPSSAQHPDTCASRPSRPSRPCSAPRTAKQGARPSAWLAITWVSSTLRSTYPRQSCRRGTSPGFQPAVQRKGPRGQASGPNQRPAPPRRAFCAPADAQGPQRKENASPHALPGSCTAPRITAHGPAIASQGRKRDAPPAPFHAIRPPNAPASPGFNGPSPARMSRAMPPEQSLLPDRPLTLAQIPKRRPTPRPPAGPARPCDKGTPVTPHLPDAIFPVS